MENNKLFCKNCGRELEDDSKFCPGCGMPIQKPKIIEVIKCRNCGSKIEDDNKFCPQCGTPILESNIKTTENKKEKLDTFNCPVCRGILSSNTIKCPFCGNEIHNREVVSSVKEFAKDIASIDDEMKKIETIKLFPIPNTKEDITEFMHLATSNFDVKNYSVAKAWYTKIEQCYNKAKVMFDPDDMVAIETLYQNAQSKIEKVRKGNLKTILIGIGCIVLSFIVLVLGALVAVKTDIDEIGTVCVFISIFILLPIGIPFFIVGLKKRKNRF